MDTNEAHRVANKLRLLGLRGIVSPEALDNPDGQWRVYDSSDPVARRDITDEVLTVIAGRSRQDGQSGATRGFVLPTPR
ncbi:hypothetical protein [Kitasatospora sp. NPDC091207]|uniref:hypothetical protein n=1 Tax=Kitasatospora sp. NPDC091207 TaxID=3364083 RepID=UPI00381197B8